MNMKKGIREELINFKLETEILKNNSIKLQNKIFVLELKEGEYLIIHTLAVHYSFYGKGYATEMVNFAKNLAKELGYKAVRVDVVPDNYPARRLYESLGFSYAGNKDLSRNFEHIPTFCLYEFDLTKEKTVFD